MQEDVAKLILRVSVGVMMLFHGASKVLHGTGFIEGMLTDKGLPAFMAYGVYVGEIIAPILLIIGFYTRISAAILAFNMVVAIGLVHMGEILKLTEHGAWAIELQMFYLVTAVVIFLLGAGQYSLDYKRTAR
ncbi:MAG: DoxX family membrane protein [Epsilonproteobacteria bacterium]|nr:DoxX family membrane protein [Campylobacterota bacterium]